MNNLFRSRSDFNEDYWKHHPSTKTYHPGMEVMVEGGQSFDQDCPHGMLLLL